MLRLAVGIALIATPALAQPRYDVEAHCDEIAGFGGTYSNEMFNFCIDSEQTAYNALKAQWGSVPESTAEHCNEIATFGTGGSYEMLKFCIDQESRAASDRGTFQY